MSVLLTDEAVQAASPSWFINPKSCIAEFLRYHATEGRPALVDAMRRVIDDHWGEASLLHRGEAEALVTALFGEASP